MTFTRIHSVLIILILILFSLGNLARVSFLNQQINGYFYEAVILLHLLFLMLIYRVKPYVEVFRKWKITVLFFLAISISYFTSFVHYSLYDNSVAGLYIIRLFLYFSYFFYLGYLLKEIVSIRNILQRAILLFTVLTFITSLGQYLLYPDLRNLFYLGWDPHLYRMFGVFLDTSVTAAIFGCILIYLTMSQWRQAKKLRVAFIAGFFIMLLLTYSRSSYFAIIIVCLFYLFTKKKMLVFFLFLGTMLMSLYLIPRPFGEGVNLLRTFSIESRIQDYGRAFELWRKKPLLGYGYNRLRQIKGDRVDSHAASAFHSTFLTILVSSGVIGLFAFLSCLYLLARISEVSFYLILFSGVMSLFDNIILHPFVLFLVFFLVLASVKNLYRTLR